MVHFKTHNLIISAVCVHHTTICAFWKNELPSLYLCLCLLSNSLTCSLLLWLSENFQGLTVLFYVGLISLIITALRFVYVTRCSNILLLLMFYLHMDRVGSSKL